MRKFTIVLGLLLSFLSANRAAAQFPSPLSIPDKFALIHLQNNGFLPSTYTIPDTIHDPSDTLAAAQVGILFHFPSMQGQDFRVRSLDLRGRMSSPTPIYNIMGAFDSNGLSGLQYLNLSNNFLTDSLVSLAGFTRNEPCVVILDSNQLSAGVVPEFLAFMPNLQELHMVNAFDNAVRHLPANIMHPTLKVLNLAHNSINTFPATVFDSLPAIEHISFAYNILGTIPHPTQFSSLPFIDPNIPPVPYYTGLQNLKSLDLSHNQLAGGIPIDQIITAQLRLSRANRPLQTLDFSNNAYSLVADSLALRLLAADTTTLLPNVSFFPNLLNVRVDSNRLEFDDLFLISITMGKRMLFESSISFPQLVYHAQDSIGQGGIRRRSPGRPLDFQLPSKDRNFRPDPNTLARLRWWGAVRNGYAWYWGDQNAIATNNTSQIYMIGRYQQQSNSLNITAPGGVPALDAQAGLLTLRDSATTVAVPEIGMIADSLLDSSYIFPAITNPKFPALTLLGRKKRIRIGECYDNQGQVVNCQEIAVQIQDNATAAQMDAARQELGATIIDSCVCGKIQLWSISDTFQQTSMEANGAGTRIASTQASTKPGLKSADNNYPLSSTTNQARDTTPHINIQGNRQRNRTVVAIIDSGTDPDHPRLEPFINYNTRENNDPDNDLDANCENGDIVGFNYVDRNNVPYDDHGHGTTVGGIVAGFASPNIASPDSSIALLPIKYTNSQNYGSTFEASCAIYYAADYHINRADGTHSDDSVRVINASWGYIGEPCQVLKDAIEYAGSRCGILFVCSAGNESNNNEDSTSAHYPSNYPLPNILSVTALNTDNQTLTSYANYGTTKVHLATYGAFANGLIPQTGSNPDSTTAIQNGTSFSTALVSRAAALLFQSYPEASFYAVKHALMHTATPLAGTDATKIASGSLNFASASNYMAANWDKTQCTDIVSSTNQLQQTNSAHISPNPVSYALRIDHIEPATLTAFDANGRQVLSLHSQDNSSTINVEQLPQGVYFLRIQFASHTETHKFLKINN